MTEKVHVLDTAGGALGLGRFAAAIGACCAFPWAVALFGVSGAVALARLSFLLHSQSTAALANHAYP